MTENRLSGPSLERAIALREQDGLSFARIGEQFGISEAGAANAVLAGLCARKGFRPAARDANGHLMPAEIERMRLMLRKGLKGVDIALRMGVSQSVVSHERRRYSAYLKANGKAPLPAPGNGEAYSGARIPAKMKREAERLFLEGYGNQKIHDATGISLTQIGRIRTRLVKRLKRKGECLPGCDANGKRHVIKDSVRRIPETSIQKLRELIMAGTPVLRASKIAGIGTCSAYRLRDRFKAELEAQGETLPAPKLPGRVKGAFHPCRRAGWLKPTDYTRYRTLIREHGEEEARRILKAEYAAEREKMRREDPFAYQMARLQEGAALTHKVDIRPAGPGYTLGGIASAAMEAAA